jgi:uncharacterized protein involved in response to NO
MFILICLLGGRLVPSFTRNWLVRRDSARQAPGRLPRPFERFDAIAVAVSAVALVLWIALPFERATGFLLILAGLMQLVRLARWAGDRTVRDRLVLVLHVGYAFVPLGFFLVGGAALDLVPPAAGIHAWTGGAVAVMMLAVMTRASLGHTGRELVASAGTQAVYAAAAFAAVVRICAAMHQEWVGILLLISGAAWAGAFLGFAVLYGPMLCTGRAPRPPSTPPG